MSKWFELVVSILATWRVCYLIAREDGPFDLILHLRTLAGAGVVGRLMDCPYCLSLWVAAPVAVGQASRPREGILLWLAIAGGSCLVQMAAEGLQALARPPIQDLPFARGYQQLNPATDPEA